MKMTAFLFKKFHFDTFSGKFERPLKTLVLILLLWNVKHYFNHCQRYLVNKRSFWYLYLEIWSGPINTTWNCYFVILKLLLRIVKSTYIHRMIWLVKNVTLIFYLDLWSYPIIINTWNCCRKKVTLIILLEYLKCLYYQPKKWLVKYVILILLLGSLKRRWAPKIIN